jgi:hypothetical protein
MSNPDPRRTELRPEDPENEPEEAPAKDSDNENMSEGKHHKYNLEPIPESGTYDPSRVNSSSEGQGQGGSG